MSSLQVEERSIDSYRTIAAPVQAKLTRKKSRFIALIYPVSSVEEVGTRLAEVKRSYHDASHRCYAYRVRTKAGTITRADDAGEPAGSAGPPILQALEGADLYDVLAVVVRYFGGVKLGIGGLIRAYGDATREAIAQARVVERVQQVRIRVVFPPELSSPVMGLIHRFGARVEGISYDTRGQALVLLPRSAVSEFTAQLQEATSGQVRITETG